jgi:ParB-like chromosome segregation protein Spo0J
MTAKPEAAEDAHPMATTRTVARRPVAGLRPHPELLAVLGAPADEEVERLARNLEAGRPQGLLAEVTPDGQVIFGHLAVLAAQSAGLDEVEVVVREDLGGAPEAVVALAVIDGLLGRGGLDHLGTARALARAHQLRPHVPYSLLRDYQRGRLDEQLARRIKVSVRAAQRYARLVQTPAEVQQAFLTGELHLTVAERVAGLPEPRQAELAAALRAGEDPSKAVARFVKMPPARHQKAHDAWAAFVTALARGLADLDGRAERIKALSPEDATVVDDAIALLQQVRGAAAVMTPEQQAAALQSVLGELKGIGPTGRHR